MISEDGKLFIAPEFIPRQEKREVQFPYDRHFQRRFFREYFNGNEKITILLKTKPTSKERKDISDFLQRFMAAQVVEESDAKIVVKCFGISELSIEECLRRMHYLSLNMFEEILGNKEQVKLTEIRMSITKFYYMLVMQVRRYLSEGRYIKENQIPLIRAMDLRMAAEKMQRIASIVPTLDSQEKTIIEKIKGYYAAVFASFVSEDYEKSLLLWQQGRQELESLNKLKEQSGKKKDIATYQFALQSQQIVSLAKEISMLVR